MASPRNGDQGRPDLGVGGGKESAPSVECQKNRLFILHEKAVQKHSNMRTKVRKPKCTWSIASQQTTSTQSPESGMKLP